MITRTREGWSYTKVANSEFIKYIVQAYGFLLPVGVTETFSQFADRIAKHYSTENPHNAFVVYFLKSVEK